MWQSGKTISIIGINGNFKQQSISLLLPFGSKHLQILKLRKPTVTIASSRIISWSAP